MSEPPTEGELDPIETQTRVPPESGDSEPIMTRTRAP